MMIPTPSEDILSGILEGRGTIAAGNYTITAECKKIVDFSQPFARGAKEIIVAAKGTSNLNELEDRRG